MVGVFIALFLAGLLALIVSLTQEKEDKNPILTVLLVGYFLRLLVRTFNRSLPLFSDGQTLGGGDSMLYEEWADYLIQFWNKTGIHFVTSGDHPGVDQIPLPINLIAFVGYFNEYYSAIGCVSIISFLACLTALVLYRAYIFHDLERKTGFYAMCFVFFSPSFVMFTSDFFKEGIVAFFVISVFSIFIHTNKKNININFVLLIFCVLCINWTRYYILYAIIPSFCVWIAMLMRNKSLSFGNVYSVLFVFFLLGIIGAGIYLKLDVVYQKILLALNEGYGSASLIENMGGNSGIDIDGGNPSLATLPMRILYTIFTPFPWQGGSLGFNLSKIEMLFWYFVLYWAYRGAVIFLKRDFLMTCVLLVFIIGLTVAYAGSFANIGIIYRQRLIIFYVASILAVWGRVAARQKSQVS